MSRRRDQRSDWPELRMMTSTGLPASDAPGNFEAREPKGREVSVSLLTLLWCLTRTDYFHQAVRSGGTLGPAGV